MNKILNWQFVRYGIVGILNTLLGIGIFNFFMWISGITRGIEITFFSMATFAIVVTHSFFWNKRIVFQSKERAHREYVLFFTVSTTVALLNVGIISFLVNGLGAPAGISPILWANIAVLITIPVSVLGNFFGYKLLVFKRPVGEAASEASPNP
ncbi:MAG: GtrA family protein [bacterium]|nr:GtrA family protein [bacterium]